MHSTASDPLVGSFNLAAVRGALTTEVRISELATGSVVHNFEVKTADGEAVHVVPVAWYDPVRPPRLQRGDEVVVVGALRRRWFRAGASSQSRTELMASCVARSSSTRAQRALARAAAALEATATSR